jgi:hypothetical protein
VVASNTSANVPDWIRPTNWIVSQTTFRLQVGASNELPESEELDALYDRFLLRRRVSQVSQAGLLEMLANGGGRKQVGAGTGWGREHTGLGLGRAYMLCTHNLSLHVAMLHLTCCAGAIHPAGFLMCPPFECPPALASHLHLAQTIESKYSCRTYGLASVRRR